jgi:hypothetical protein
LLRDLLLDGDLGLENLLGGFLLQGGELFDDFSLGIGNANKGPILFRRT